MTPLLAAVPTLAVSVIFCLYNTARQARLRQVRRLCQRVSYMLWTMAEQIEDSG